MALVDILMPTYKPRKEHLLAAIESVRAQTEADWILTICDEPTEVDTAAIVQSIVDDRIRYTRNERRLGIGGNWNRCLQYVTAPYVQYLFQDDLLAPNYLGTAVAAMESDERIGMVSMGHVYSFEEGAILRPVYNQVTQAFAALKPGYHKGIDALRAWVQQGLRPNIVGEPSFVLLRKSTMDTVGLFHETMRQFLDAEYWVRLLAVSDWYVIQGNFGSFRVHPSGASAQNAENHVGRLDRLLVLRRAHRIVPIHHRREFRRITRMQFARFFERFLLEHGGASVQLNDKLPFLLSLALHPFLMLRSVWQYKKNLNRE